MVNARPHRLQALTRCTFQTERPNIVPRRDGTSQRNGPITRTVRTMTQGKRRRGHNGRRVRRQVRIGVSHPRRTRLGRGVRIPTKGTTPMLPRKEERNNVLYGLDRFLITLTFSIQHGIPTNLAWQNLTGGGHGISQVHHGRYHTE